jgi:hypothetical protein
MSKVSPEENLEKALARLATVLAAREITQQDSHVNAAVNNLVQKARAAERAEIVELLWRDLLWPSDQPELMNMIISAIQNK